MKKHTSAWPFLKPVSLSEAPDYHQVITEPMDFETMTEKIKLEQYTSAEKFIYGKQITILLFTHLCQTLNSFLIIAGYSMILIHLTTSVLIQSRVSFKIDLNGLKISTSNNEGCYNIMNRHRSLES